jgi:hypothetical protein
LPQLTAGTTAAGTDIVLKIVFILIVFLFIR